MPLREKNMRMSKFWKICLAALLIASLAYVTVLSPAIRARISDLLRHPDTAVRVESTSLSRPNQILDSLRGQGESQGTPPSIKNDDTNKGNSGEGSNGKGKEQVRPEQPTKLLCMTFSGRLGNQLFQYASAIGLAKRLNRIPAFKAGSELSSALQHPPPLHPIPPAHKRRCQVAKRQGEKNAHCCKFHKEFVELDPDHDYRISQYLQSWRYFEGYEDEVKRAMQFKDPVRAEADRRLAELRQQHVNRTLVGIHVRRGDYLRDLHLRMGYRTAPPDYFTRAMDFMRRRFGNVTFFVSADDAGKTWFSSSVPKTSVTSSSASSSDVTNQTVAAGGSGGGGAPMPSSGGTDVTGNDVIMLKRVSVAGDMALLASMDHSIISVGTYSWWVGFLNRGVTIYWKDFVVPGTEIGNQFLPNGDTYVHPSWVPL